MFIPMPSGPLPRRRYASPSYGLPTYGLLDALDRPELAPLANVLRSVTPPQLMEGTGISPFRWLAGQVGLLDALGEPDVGTKDRASISLPEAKFDRTKLVAGIRDAVAHDGGVLPWQTNASGDPWHAKSVVDLGEDAREIQPRTLQLAAGAGGPGAQPETIDEICRRYEGYADDLRELNADVAADAMRRYLDKTGGVMQIAPKQLRGAPVVQQAQEGIYQHFKNWMTHASKEAVTLGGKSPGNRGWPWQGIASDLRSLRG